MGKHYLDLREVKNQTCLRCLGEERKALTEEGLCTKVQSEMDGLPIRCVGEWAYEKIYRLVQYYGIFSRGMKDKWEGRLNYVEICSGPGRCVTKNNGMEMDGTSLAIVRHPSFSLLKAALFVDNNPVVVDALNARIRALKSEQIASARIGDHADQKGIAHLLGQLPKGCLNLVLVDPTGCDVPFATIRTVFETLNNVDFLINVMLGADATRNLPRAILKPSWMKARTKYEMFLGCPGFCKRSDVVAAAKAGNDEQLRRIFADEYMARLKEHGFIHMDMRPVRHYYYLLFASRHPKGLEFWNEACRIDPNNQREFELR
ncbi:MAG: three-Cys-motif partner protein TcmP [Verrucomicrobiota bacterium]